MLALGLLLLEALLLLWHGSMQRHEVLLHKSNDFMAPESLTYAMVESAYELSCNVAFLSPNGLLDIGFAAKWAVIDFSEKQAAGARPCNQLFFSLKIKLPGRAPATN